MKVLVALSGGIDSSVALHLLSRRGAQCIGVMMKFWMDPTAPPTEHVRENRCCSLEHERRARHICSSLGIPFYVFNAEEPFLAHVVQPFLEEYARGRTPNPCIACNKHLKFGVLLTLAKRLQCDKIATGHFARIRRTLRQQGTRFDLLEAMDRTKDQSYYLYRLTQRELQRIEFPLGNMRKSEVFTLAKTFGIPLPSGYRESGDLCFFPERSPLAFLRRYIRNIPRGPLKLLDDTVIGTHDGLPFYTEGQRRGVHGGGTAHPLRIVFKEQKSNTIFVSSNRDLHISGCILSKVSWVSGIPENFSLTARTRSLQPRVSGTLSRKGSRWQFKFRDPLETVSPGQSLVLYDGKRVVGGGIIDTPIRIHPF